jgi:ribonuclease BN (tRNA processing enzyme)
VLSRELVHTSPCFGYRFEFGRVAVAYCTDTGVCDNAVRLGMQADVFITECALRSGQPDDGWPHLDPRAAARLAVRAKARKLVLTHFDAHNYQTVAQRREAQRSARRIFPRAVAASDGLRISIFAGAEKRTEGA